MRAARVHSGTVYEKTSASVSSSIQVPLFVNLAVSEPESAAQTISDEGGDLADSGAILSEMRRLILQNEAPHLEICGASFENVTPVIQEKSSASSEERCFDNDRTDAEDSASAGAAAASAAVPDVQAESAFFELLDRKILADLTYPERARRRSLEGAVTVLLRIGVFGTLDSYRIVSGSGSAILDDAAVQLLERIFPLTEYPLPYPVETSVRIVYSLRAVGNV